MKRTIGLLVCLSSVAFPKDIVIHAGRLIDGSGGAPRTQVSILIKDDKITGVQAGFVNVPGAEVIDLSKATVLPGLIDAHKHIGSGGGRRGGRGAVVERGARTNLDAVLAATRSRPPDSRRRIHRGSQRRRGRRNRSGSQARRRFGRDRRDRACGFRSSR